VLSKTEPCTSVCPEGRRGPNRQAVQLDLADMYVKFKNVEGIAFRTAWMHRKGIRDAALSTLRRPTAHRRWSTSP
jgi:hypothetical protein